MATKAITTGDDIRKAIAKATPKKEIKTISKGGKDFPYVEAAWIRQRLDELFSPMGWDFKIVDDHCVNEHVIVLGRLTIKTMKDGEIVTVSSRDQYGGSIIRKYGRNSQQAGQPIDIGNNFKAAASDALKKCAGSLGIAPEVYGRPELNTPDEEDGKAKYEEIDTYLDVKARTYIGKDEAKANNLRRRINAIVELSTEQRATLLSKLDTIAAEILPF